MHGSHQETGGGALLLLPGLLASIAVYLNVHAAIQHSLHACDPS